MAERSDVIQVTDKNSRWYGSLLYVDKVMKNTVQAMLLIPGEGEAYIRLDKSEFEVIGKSVLELEDEE